MMWIEVLRSEIENARKKIRLKGSRTKGGKRERKEEKIVCRWCGSRKVVKNGKKADGRQNYLCRECGRQMVENPKYKRMREEDLELAVKMKDEGMSYSAIARVLGYSEATIRMHLLKKNVEDALKYVLALAELLSKLKKALKVSIDEMCSYVGSKRNKVWIITFVINITKDIILSFSVVRRRRDRESLRSIIDLLPEAEEYHTDGWSAYKGLFEGKGKHVVHIKKEGPVNLNEGLHNRLRIYNSRLKRKGHAYSKRYLWHVIDLFALWWRKGWLLNHRNPIILST